MINAFVYSLIVMMIMRMKMLLAEDILPLHQNSVTKSTIAGSGARDKKLPEFCRFSQQKYHKRKKLPQSCMPWTGDIKRIVDGLS